MKLDLFINRPVLSTVISIFIVILGTMGLMQIPITQYPDIAPPTVQVSTAYMGANAQTVLNSVIAPLEEQINGVENMDYMSSSATNTGQASIQITFKMGTDPDMAAVNVQNRVAKATGLLPAEVTQVGVITQKRQSSMLMVFSLVDTEDRYSSDFLENYAKINLIPQVQRVAGVGDAKVFAGSYAMRIWLDPEKMASYGLIPTDVSAVLAEQNIEAAPGNIGEREHQTFQYTLRYRGRLQEASQFENIVIKSNADGSLIRLKDIARVELGSESYSFGSRTNGHKSVGCMVSQIAGSNATKIIQDIEKTLEESKSSMPAGLEIHIAQNVNDFLFASIHEVVKTLIEAFVLVFLVVFIFLQDLRSTLIPTIAIPVALVGTFLVLNLIGFSLNLLTLSALVLAIAIVVDDAIVVVEGVHAKLDLGYTSARTASLDAMRELGGAIVSITLVMMAVFVPVSFMGGTSGAFYRQFGITMAVAIGFSALNALTLSPALCAIFLKPHNDHRSLGERVQVAQKAALEQMKQKYAVKGKKFGLSLPPWLTLLLLVTTIVMMVVGLFTFENVIVSIIAWCIAIVAILGLFSDRFIEECKPLCSPSLALHGVGGRFHRRFVLDDASHAHHPCTHRRHRHFDGYGGYASWYLSRPHRRGAPTSRKNSDGITFGEKYNGHLRILHDGRTRSFLRFFLYQTQTLGREKRHHGECQNGVHQLVARIAEILQRRASLLLPTSDDYGIWHV